jgi:DNA-binding CsgD family transcriptional regulator
MNKIVSNQTLTSDNSDTLSELIHMIYESVADPRGWETYAKRVLEVLDADFYHTLISDFSSPSHNYGVKSNPETGRLKAYEGEIYQESKIVEILNQLKDKKVFLAKDFFYQSEQLFNDSRAALKNDFSCDNFIATHTKTRQKPPYYVMHMFGRDSEKPRFDNHQKVFLETLSEHVERAYALALTMNHLSDLNKFIVRTLDHIPTGVLIISNRGSVITMNRLADSYIKEGYFIIDDNHISLSDTIANETMQKAMSQSIDNESAQGHYIPVKKSDDSKMYLCCLPHLLTHGSLHNHEWRLGDSAQNVIFITDETRQISLPWENLKLIYNLTSSESRVVELLVNGKSTEDIAHTLDINANSVRFHLKNCFHKTRVNNQAELVGLILRTLGSFQ